MSRVQELREKIISEIIEKVNSANGEITFTEQEDPPYFCPDGDCNAAFTITKITPTSIWGYIPGIHKESYEFPYSDEQLISDDLEEILEYLS